MNFLNIIKERYTTKKYDSNEKISKKTIEQLQEILRLSPSAINSQPWKFIWVFDAALKDRLAPYSFHNKERVEDCQCLVVLCHIADVAVFEKQLEENNAPYMLEYFLNHVKPQGETAVTAWFSKQVYISLGVLLSACAAMEVDSTPMEGIELEKYSDILSIEGYKPLVAVALGKRHPSDENQLHIKPKSRLPKEKVTIEL